ncbi:MAG TPA: hypothetical protein VJI74_01615 [Candidatus Paceibacterota bacterium]
MVRKQMPRHQKAPPGGIWRGRRLEGPVENRGIKPVKKPKKGKE